MPISPPSDIILDVARAVEPAALEAARAKLRSIAQSRGADAALSASGQKDMRGSPVARAERKGPPPDTFVKFEAMMLQNFLQNILPKDAENVYGTGLAGDMWKSFLAQELATQMAERGGIGIADRVLGDYYLSGEKRVPVAGVSGDPQAKEDADTQDLLSVALVQKIQRTIVNSFEDAAAATGATAKP